MQKGREEIERQRSFVLVFADVEFFAIVPVAVIVMLMSVFMSVRVVVGVFMVVFMVVRVFMVVFMVGRMGGLMGGRGQRRKRLRFPAEEEIGKIACRGGEHELDREDDADGEELALPGKFCKGEDEQGFVVGPSLPR